MDEEFHAAVKHVQSSKSGNLSNETKLQFYALFKQATEGPANPSKAPSRLKVCNDDQWCGSNVAGAYWLQIVERAKFDAWAKVGLDFCVVATS